MDKLQEQDIFEKTMIVRCDFNVSVKDGKIIDDTKIVESLETINYLLAKNCKIILMSHFGKVKTEEDKGNNSLLIIKESLEKHLNRQILFSKYTSGIELNKMVNNLNCRDILLMENTRFEDIPNNLESGCDIQLSMYWSSLGDIFVNDAFGSCHRSHASVVGIANQIPSCAGFLVQKEVQNLQPVVNDIKRPFTIIMGGSKIEDKILLIEKLIKKCDYLLLGGAIANTFLKALKIDIGSSLVNDSVLESVKKILIENKDKIILPTDVVVGNNYDENYVEEKSITNLDPNDIIFDVGSDTIERFKDVIEKSETVFVNGTIGKYEDVRFRNGTLMLLNILAKFNKIVIIGGGDAVSSVNTLGYTNEMTYLSTGGGATLEYIADGHLPGIDAIGKIKNN